MIGWRKLTGLFTGMIKLPLKRLPKKEIFRKKCSCRNTQHATGNEAINTAEFNLYLESDKTGPTLLFKDVKEKFGTLAEGLYSAKFGHRNKKKYQNELAIRIYYRRIANSKW